MPTCSADRSSRAHGALNGSHDRVAPTHGLVVSHTHHHEPEPMKLEVAPSILGALLRGRVPSLTVHFDDDTRSDQQIDEADPGDVRLRRDAEPLVVQCQPHERLSARARPCVGEVHPRSTFVRHGGLERGQLMRTDEADV